MEKKGGACVTAPARKREDTMIKLKTKMVSSLEKCFYDDPLESKTEVTRFTVFRNERLSFQVAYRAEHPDPDIKRWCPIKLGGDLAAYAKVRLVGNVLNMYPTYNVPPAGEFLRTEPGAYPDMLTPFVYPNAVSLPHGQTHALFVDISLPEGFPAGTYSIILDIFDQGERLSGVAGEVRVLDAELPAQRLIHTEWFYTDSIANHYHCKAFSERHWQLIESYMRTATQNGINMVLTPIFTPELDTYVGGERLTTQLLDIALTDEGVYKFGFEKLHRWIDTALRCGYQYFEIPHFFTQWGAHAAPKIIVKVKGKKKKLFGWHTEALGKEYEDFLSQLIPALLGEFRKRGIDRRCFFHVSDEPHLETLTHYTKCRELIERYLGDYPIMDALSDLEFYSRGATKKPVPNTRNAEKFYNAGVSGLWAYYCGGGKEGVSDRSISMPLRRTRILGVQLYKYNIEGFLHWGYNFYNSCQSHSLLDPFGYADGGYFTPAGDCFLVYPGTDGEAWGSLRLNALREAVDDMRALDLYESRFGRDAAERLLLEEAGGPLTFTDYPTQKDFLPRVRARIAEAFS